MRLKGYHIVLLFTWFCVLTATAQPRLRQPEMYIGVHGGVLASMMMWLPEVEGTSRIEQTVMLSGNGGFVFRYAHHKYCGLQVELNYMQRGWREKVPATETQQGGYYKRCLNYLELPFLMHIYFGKNAGRGFVNLGPQIGYCFKESWSGVKNTQEENPAQYKKLDRPFDWGIAGGIGGYYRSEKAGVFQIEARFNYSLGDSFANGKADYFDMSHAMNLSLNLAYLWQIK